MTDKAAEKMLANPDKLESFLNEGTNRADYARNLELIRFKIVGMPEIEFKEPVKDLSALRSRFLDMRFFSVINDTAWPKFAQTFEVIY